MSGITTHVLDTSRGIPAAGVRVTLELVGPQGQWQLVAQGSTDADGRLQSLTPPAIALTPGIYRLVFETRRYFESQAVRTFHPHVAVAFDVTDSDGHYHVPLLLSPFGYTTYRGS